MVEEKNKIYLVSGGKLSQRRKAISSLRIKISGKKKSPLSLITFYSDSLDLEFFKESLFTLSFQKKKIVLIKDFSNLKKPVKRFIFDNLSGILNFNYLIFESETPYFSLKEDKKIISDDFFNLIFKKSVKYQGKNEFIQDATIEDFRRKLYRNDLKDCLFLAEKILSSKSGQKAAATQILGLLSNKFSYLKDKEKKERVFNQLWMADRALKETNTDTRLLIEKLLVSLI